MKGREGDTETQALETKEIRKRRGGVKRERRGGEGEGKGVKRKGEEEWSGIEER